MNIAFRSRLIMCGFILGLIASLCSPYLVYASSPGPDPNSTPVTVSKSTANSNSKFVPVQQDAKWLAAKNAFRVRSGIKPGKVKGQATSSYIEAEGNSFAALASTPSAKTLSLDSYAWGTWEPSNGYYPNQGAGTSSTDDAGTTYYNHNFFNMCGPGAADIALDFWPAPPNLAYNYAEDPSYNAYTGSRHITYWNGYKMRGYMTRLAWDILPPTWPNYGMMDTAHYPSYGVTHYSMAEALNWKASGHNSNRWQSYFYVIAWWDQNNNPAIFHNHVVSDIANSNVPVVAGVNATLLPNWTGQTGMVKHYITVVGYDDNAGTYAYTDTCAKSTNCNGLGSNFDGQVKYVSQSVMWNAITSVPVNRDPGSSGGDGGWIW
jgi:hypothetical protein